MPKLSPRSVTLLDGAIVLSRRDGSAKWQARFKNGSRWIRVTTKEKNLKYAKEVARESLYGCSLSRVVAIDAPPLGCRHRLFHAINGEFCDILESFGLCVA